eukprot:TRINITY_DN4539_c0_g1_i1.p1 TRINITY_DN4539_c0_g1~~TRINITY_DN4539_c0_g1_i1.p1  ORF type:complete len:210 (-),score=102.73 TRINITY_DN4539_c0_g1_i1:35-664(-)
MGTPASVAPELHEVVEMLTGSLGGIGVQQRLRRLSFKGYALGSALHSLLESLSSLSFLTHLTLDNQQIGDKGASLIAAALRDGLALHTLALEHNNLSAAALGQLRDGVVDSQLAVFRIPFADLRAVYASVGAAGHEGVRRVVEEIEVACAARSRLLPSDDEENAVFFKALADEEADEEEDEVVVKKEKKEKKAKKADKEKKKDKKKSKK